MSYLGTHKKGERLYAKMSKETQTEQSHKQECDINYIMQRYRKTGILPTRINKPVFADVANVGGFDKAMDIVAKGMSEFHKLPEKIRLKYDNDPRKWLKAAEESIIKRGEMKLQKKKDEETAAKIKELENQVNKGKEKGP